MNKFTILFLSIITLTSAFLTSATYNTKHRDLSDSSVVPGENDELQQRKEDYSMIKRVPREKWDGTKELNIVDIITDDSSLSTLKNALETAEMMEDISGSGPLTVFAPSDEAFAKLSPNMMQDLLNNENRDKLIEILKYHIVPGKIDSSNLKTMKLKSANGKTLDIKVNGDTVTINNAKITKKDINAANGTIHIIDTVLLP